MNPNIKDLGTITDFNLLKDEFDYILSPQNIDYKENQLALQKPTDWDEVEYGREEWCSVGKPSFLPGKYQHNEELFTTTIDILKGSYIEELMSEYSLFKTRCAIVPPKSCYTWHYDNWPRIHFVIQTNPKCFFLFGDHKKEHLEVGKIYFTDTTDPTGHTAINASWHYRIHIFGNIKKFGDRTWKMTEQQKEFNIRERERDFNNIHVPYS